MAASHFGERMTVRVLFFAHLRDAAGVGSATVELSAGATLRALRELLSVRFPALDRRLEGLPCLIDGRLAAPEDRLVEGTEVAWIPPVAGGAPGGVLRAELTRSPLSLAALVTAVSHPEAGAVVSFLGIVRDREGERRVERLEYEAYERVAGPALAALARECVARWPDARVALAHRVGALAIGEASVAIAVAAPHRAEAFEACRYLIEGVKTRVPVWKKSFGPGGAWWVEGETFEAGGDAAPPAVC